MNFTDVLVEGTTTALSTANKQHRNSKRPPEYTSAHYEPINKNGSYIRVLKLFSSNPNNPQVECRLIQTSLDDEVEHPYEALSWCWGALPETSYINIRKGSKMYAKYVKPDLVSALQALRHYQNDRYLWIDAVCSYSYRTAMKYLRILRFAPLFSGGINLLYHKYKGCRGA
jgi:hypothetical protein